MTEPSIVVEASTLRFRRQGPATGNLWLAIDGQDFPAHGWNDFVVVILSWWVAAVLRLMRFSNGREIVDFMEGPYAVEVSKTPSGKLRFRALAGRERTGERAIGEGWPLPFILGLISQSRHVLTACRQQHWWSDDAETLEYSLEALEELASQLLS